MNSAYTLTFCKARDALKEAMWNFFSAEAEYMGKDLSEFEDLKSDMGMSLTPITQCTCYRLHDSITLY
jgi:hypothetical protein